MKDNNQVNTGYYTSETCNLANFQKIIDQNLAEESAPYASEVRNNIPIYNIAELKNVFQS